MIVRYGAAILSLALDAGMAIAILYLSYLRLRISPSNDRLFFQLLEIDQSLMPLFLALVFRLGSFFYISIRMNRAHLSSTRCNVYLMLMVQFLIFSLGAIQFFLWLTSSFSFRFYRSSQEMHGDVGFEMMFSLFFLNGMFQMYCILRINHRTTGEKIMEQLMLEASHSTRNLILLGNIQDEEHQKMLLWKQKWRNLVRKFTGGKTNRRLSDGKNISDAETSDVFQAILRLYAQKGGAVERLASVYYRKPIELEFYIPQLCNLLLLGPGPDNINMADRPNLYIFFLEICQRSHVFAHKLYWFLRSFCIGNHAYITDGNQARIHQLMDEVKAQGDIPAKKCLKQDHDEEQRIHINETSSLISHRSSPCAKTTSKMVEQNPFEVTLAFIDALSELSDALRDVVVSKRNEVLHSRLTVLDRQYMPSSCLYFPVGQAFHCVKRILVEESFTFSTRERVPFLLCLEIVDLVAQHDSKRDQMLPSFQSFREGMKELRLSIFEKPELDELSSPKASPAHHPNLGFWSNSPKSTASRTLASNLIDTIAQKKKQFVSSHLKTTGISPSPDDEDEEDTDRSLSPMVRSPHSTNVENENIEQFLQSFKEEDAQFHLKDIEEGSIAAAEAQRQGHDNKPKVVFTEKWTDKEARLRATSRWGSRPGWRLLPVIVKSNDDLRQEQFASQLIQQFDHIFKEAKLPVMIQPYNVIAVSPTAGLVEAISDTISLDALKKNDPSYTTLLDFFHRRFGDSGTAGFNKARRNFVSSMAGYSMLCYLLQIKDRHNGNILLHADGRIIHVDFGFILTNNPGNMNFENAPFKLTNEFVELMGGSRSASFRRFRSLCVRTFLIARQNRHRIVLLIEMMLQGNAELPCFSGNGRNSVDRLTRRFQLHLDIHECEDFVHGLIDTALGNWRTRWYDKYQRWIAGVY